MPRTLVFVVTTVAICLATLQPAGHATAQSFPQVNDTTTFKAFGEKAGLVRIMDDLMVNLLADPRTRPFFESSDKTRVKEQLVDQFCEILRGPCVYGGAKMRPIHAGHDIKREHFNALVEALQQAMDKNGVPFVAQNKLLAILAPMQREIVNQ